MKNNLENMIVQYVIGTFDLLILPTNKKEDNEHILKRKSQIKKMFVHIDDIIEIDVNKDMINEDNYCALDSYLVSNILKSLKFVRGTTLLDIQYIYKTKFALSKLFLNFDYYNSLFNQEHIRKLRV